MNESILNEKPTWKERQRKQLYQELINSAVKLFAEKGLDEPSVDEIVAETGVAKGTFYLYFKNKSEIITAVVDSGLCELEERVAKAQASSGDNAPDTLRACIQEVISFFESNKSMIGLLIDGKGINSSQLSQEDGTTLRKRYGMVTTGAYERIIRKGMLQGLFREVEAYSAAHALSGMISGLIHEAIDSGKTFDEISDHIVDLFIRGVSRH